MLNNTDMIGSTGVVEDEVSTRNFQHYDTPFIKVEASKFTGGYVGRDVEIGIRDLMDTSISLVEREKYE